MATSQFIIAHQPQRSLVLDPMLEELPEITKTLFKPTLRAYRVRYRLGQWDRFEGGDVLIVDLVQPAYEGDTIVILDGMNRAWFTSYRSGDEHHGGVVIEIRKATEAARRQIERRKEMGQT